VFAGGKDISDINVADLTFPALGEFSKYGEDFMEPYNRLYQMLSFFQYMTSKTKLKEFVLALPNKDPFQSKKVAETYTPQFMKERIVDEGVKQQLDEQEQQRLPLKVFKYAWQTYLNNPAINTFLESQGTNTKNGQKGTLKFDPWFMDEWEVRDAIRFQFDFQTHRLQINKVTVKYVDDEGSAAHFTMMDDEWEEILRALVHKPEADLCIEFGVKRLEDGLELLESTNVPSVLVDFMRITDQDDLHREANYRT
jgi:hypothetical protein